jgi:hypothetical protein
MDVDFVCLPISDQHEKEVAIRSGGRKREGGEMGKMVMLHMPQRENYLKGKEGERRRGVT